MNRLIASTACFYSVLLAFTAMLTGAAFADGKQNRSATIMLTPKAEDGRYSVLVALKDTGIPALRAGDPAGAKRRSDMMRAKMLSVLAKHAPAAAAAARAGLSDRTFVKLYSELPILHLNLTENEIAAWRADPEVLSVERDTIERINSLPTSTARINAPTLWNQGIEGSGFAVVTTDTGVDHTHEFLSSRITRSACFSTGSGTDTSRSFCANNGPSEIGPGAGRTCQGITTSTGTQYAGCTHGTHVAGIGAGRDDTQSGVARAANIWAYQIFFGGRDPDDDAPTALSNASDGLAALNDVIARVNAGDAVASVNMSLGGGEFQTVCDSITRALAVNTLASLQVATVIASGNEGFNDAVSSPGCISNAITVGASGIFTNSTTGQQFEGIASFTNTSPIVDVLAPGLSISSSTVGPNTFANMSGTSQATPHVAGAVALLRSFQPSASIRDITEAMAFTGLRITDISSNFTFHRLDLAQAQQFLQQSLRLASSNAPTARFSNTQTNSTTLTMTLLNTSATNTISWSASETSPILILSTTGGTLAPSASTSIQVTVNPNTIANFRETGFVIITGTENGVQRSFEVPVHAIRAEPPPANDGFAAALALFGTNTSATGSNRQATLEPGEPRAINNAAGTASVWWSWTAPGNGTVTIDTVGSDFDTVLAAYTGDAVSALQLVAENDDIQVDDVDSRITFEAIADTRYRIQINGFGSATGNITLRIAQTLGPPSPPPVAAVLPYARAITLGQTATAFAVMLNTSGREVSGCIPFARADPSVLQSTFFSYQTTNSANQLVGNANTPSGRIPVNGQQNFVFAISPDSPLNQAEIGISISCRATEASRVVNGVNSFILSAQLTPLPDLVAIAATPTNDGIINVPGVSGESAAFAVAAVNIGATGTIVATAERGPLTPPVALLVCRTDSAGQCRPGEGPAVNVSSAVANGETALYAIFLQNTGAIPFDPANNRVFLRLRNTNGVTVGATNVAVRTP